MQTTFQIRPIDNRYCEEVAALILPIQQLEFNVPVTIKDQPDLLDIEKFYLQDGGNFWGAFNGEELVGTIALINGGQQLGAIRKMFVKKEYRGKSTGIAQLLLDTLLNYCRTHNIVHIYLGTVDQLKAAQRFYERNGFSLIEKTALPANFPVMPVDTIFYQLHLHP